MCDLTGRYTYYEQVNIPFLKEQVVLYGLLFYYENVKGNQCMKTWKTRILSAMLALLTLLTLLPTSALAASGSGTGIKATTAPNLWSTRLTSTGQPYSYRPPMAAGKQLYCMDLGYSYRYGTASFLNSYTYQSATGADADALWEKAVAKTGLGEMDAAVKENVKWMMSYIADYTGDIPGSLFMALQTYIWDHQSDKSAGGDTSGDIDAGGFANADTYETYVGYYNWMLAQKAKEDAELQKQIEEYTAQGKQASIVEDMSGKWAVLATSGTAGRQSFFAYHAARKVVTDDKPEGGDNPPPPVAGDGDITFKKVIAGTTHGLDGSVFNIYRDGQIVGSDVTKNGGIIEVKDVTKGLWTFVEVEAPEGYALDPTPHSVYVDVTDGDKQYTVSASNSPLPSLKITKADAQTFAKVKATFLVEALTGNYSTTVTVDGEKTLPDLQPGVYRVIMSLYEQLMGSDKIEPQEKSIIDRSVGNIYREYLKNYQGEPPTLKDLYDDLMKQVNPEAHRIALALELFTVGSLNVFSHQTNINTKSRIRCFDIQDLGENLKSVGLLVMLDAIYNRVIQNRRERKYTHVYIDEIYLFFANGSGSGRGINNYSSEFLYKCWKRFRKYGATLTGITQNVEECLLSNTARMMFANSEFLLMLNQATTDREQLARLLGASDTQMSYVDNAPAGHGLIKVGGAIVPFANELPKNTELYRLMSTRPGED